MSYPEGNTKAGKKRRRVRPKTPRNLPQIQNKRAEVVKLRAQGLTWDQVAARTGYASGAGAYKAWCKAISQAPNESVAEVRAAERQRLAQMDSVMSDIITSKPLRGTATGAVMLDVRTCSCGSRSDKRRDHTDECEIVPVVDAAAIIRASAERRAIGESLRKLTGADQATNGPAVVIDNRRTTIMLAEINADRALRGHPPLPVIPGFPE